MAGFLEFIDNTLGTHFDAPVYDPSKGRKKMVSVIDKAAAQHNEGKTPPTRSWKLGSNNAIRFSPKINGNPVLIGGDAENYIQADRFQDFLAGLKAAVEGGDLDEEIKAALEGEQGSTAKPARKRTTSSSNGDKPWSVRKGWGELSAEDKRAVSSRYRWGKNPDNSVIAEVGHKPDAPISAERKKA